MAKGAKFYPFCSCCGYNVTLGEHLESEYRKWQEYVESLGGFEHLDACTTLDAEDILTIHDIQAQFEFTMRVLKDRWNEPLCIPQCMDQPCMKK